MYCCPLWFNSTSCSVKIGNVATTVFYVVCFVYRVRMHLYWYWYSYCNYLLDL